MRNFLESSPLSIGALAFLIGLLLFQRAEEFDQHHSHHSSNSPLTDLLELETPFAETMLKTQDGAGLELLDRWTFLIYSGALDERGFDYPAVLLNRYHKRGLNFVYVMPSASNPAWLRSVSSSLNGRAQGFSIALDERGTFAELLGVPRGSHETYTVFVGPDTRVRFAVRKSLPSDVMRQLVERNILGTIDYSPPSPPPGYVVGSPVPEIAVRNARTGRSIPLSTLLQGQGTVLFYRANCTSCGIESEIHRLATLERTGIKEGLNKSIQGT